MKEVKKKFHPYILQSNDKDILIQCTNCDNWESQGVDDPRHHLNSLPITRWLPNSKQHGNYETSLHKCNCCDHRFRVIWNYENPID